MKDGDLICKCGHEQQSHRGESGITYCRDCRCDHFRPTYKLVKLVMRDPRIDPQPGDVLRKWDRNYTVDRVTQGLVRLIFPEWEQGILFFQRWAVDSEVMHRADGAQEEGKE